MKPLEFLSWSGRIRCFSPPAVLATALFFSFLLMVELSRAGGIVTNCTEADLRAAMAGGGTVAFACDGTIVLSDSIFINTNIVLDADGHRATISGNNSVRVFCAASNGNLTISNLTIADGRVIGADASPYSYIDGESVGGSAVANDGSLKIVNCTFTNNFAAGGAGSVGGYDGDYDGAGFTGGRAEGGAIRNNGLLQAIGCTLARNSVVGGVGGQGSGGDDWFMCNTPGHPGGTGGYGAGGAFFNRGTACLVNCTLEYNTGTGGAGGPGGPGYFYSPDYPPPRDGPDGVPGLSMGGIYNAGTLVVDLCTFVGNSGRRTNSQPTPCCGNASISSSDAEGGAICNFGTLSINRSTFTNNSVFAESGESGFYGRSAYIYKVYVVGPDNGGNGGSGGNADGGALYNAGTARVNASTFAFNSATGGNGGCGGDGGNGYTEIQVVTGGSGGNGGAAGNSTGGAVCNVGDIQIVNSTFAYNMGFPGNGGAGGLGGRGEPAGLAGTAGSNGSGVGALYSQSSSCWITNCTFIGNSAESGSNGIVCVGGIKANTSTLVNTVLAANSPNNGNFTDGGHNFISNAALELGPLADNGGATLTMALLSGSPAIDAGSTSGAPATDQRGVPRTQGTAPDIGAFEYLYTPVFTGVTFQNTTNRQLQMSGFTPDQTLTLQASTNLLDWFDVTNFLAGTNGEFQCVEPIFTDFPMRVYRVKSGSP